MWLDNDSPGCIYDTVDCTDCRGCCESEDDKTPIEIYLEVTYDSHN